MSLEVVRIRKEHLKDVAKLVCIRDKKLLEQVSSLPPATLTGPSVFQA